VIALALVAQIAVVASAPPAAVTCVPFDISVAARAAGGVAPQITLPAAPGVQVLTTRVTSRVDNFGVGDTSSLTEATFTVAVSVSGRVTLPPFVATVGARRGTGGTEPVELRHPDDASPHVLVRARLDPERDSVFVGQQVDYVVDVLLNDVARQRLRRNPTFFPPEMPGVLAYDLALPPPPRRTGPHCFEALTYRRALFPLFAGATTIAPASLTYALPVSTSFFSREETFELHTDSVRIRAVEPPAEGRPVGYIGAVGRVSASSRLATPRARMGDPVLLTLRLEAVGNVKLMPRPVITLPWATIALGDERVTVDSTAAEVRGTKEFDWLLTPRRAGQVVVPPLRYPFFDPAREAYDVAVTDSLALDVASATLATSDSVRTAPLPLRTVLRAERGAPLPSRGWFWALLALAPAPAALRRAHLRRRRPTRRRPAMQRLRALAGAGAPDAREARRSFMNALAERVPPLAATTSSVPLARVLRRAGVTDATADGAAAVLAELDLAAYAAGHVASRELAARALAAARAVDAEAVRLPGSGRAAKILILAILGSLAVGSVALPLCAAPEPLLRSFDDAVAAYRHGDFTTAERLFARVSARAPRAVDAWANLGASAWARGDTALASVGWQRALRLDPLDDDARQRFDAIQSASFGDAAYVPPVPVDVAAGAALALWIAGWIVLALPPSRRPSLAGAAAGGAFTLSLILLAAALELESMAGVRGLAALRGARPLLDAPALDASSVAAASAGEVGALGAREGAWVRVTLDDARAGWVPVASILPLDNPVD
jgi:hypothetical protein